MTTVQGQKVKATRSRDVSADKNVITRQCVVISTSNLVGIIDVGVDACSILSRSVGQTNKQTNGHSAYEMQKSTENVAKSPKCCTLPGNQGQEIERRCLSVHRNCAVQMLLKTAVNATICSTFEVQ